MDFSLSLCVYTLPPSVNSVQRRFHVCRCLRFFRDFYGNVCVLVPQAIHFFIISHTPHFIYSTFHIFHISYTTYFMYYTIHRSLCFSFNLPLAPDYRRAAGNACFSKHRVALVKRAATQAVWTVPVNSVSGYSCGRERKYSDTGKTRSLKEKIHREIRYSKAKSHKQLKGATKDSMTRITNAGTRRPCSHVFYVWRGRVLRVRQNTEKRNSTGGAGKKAEEKEEKREKRV